MENSKRQAIGNQLTAVWKKIQQQKSSKSPHQREGDVALPEPPSQHETNNIIAYGEGSRQPEVSSSSSTNTNLDSFFSDAIAPISKLNLPRLNVDPLSAFWAILASGLDRAHELDLSAVQ